MNAAVHPWEMGVIRADELRRVRGLLGLTVKDAARWAMISFTNWQKMERGGFIPTRYSLLKLCNWRRDVIMEWAGRKLRCMLVLGFGSGPRLFCHWPYCLAGDLGAWPFWDRLFDRTDNDTYLKQVKKAVMDRGAANFQADSRQFCLLFIACHPANGMMITPRETTRGELVRDLLAAMTTDKRWSLVEKRAQDYFAKCRWIADRTPQKTPEGRRLKDSAKKERDFLDFMQNTGHTLSRIGGEAHVDRPSFT